jgi:hypothetical protein
MAAVSEAAKAKQKASQLRIAASPHGKYVFQKAHAKARGIAFTLTFEEWLSLWESSGKWSLRGKKPDQYCMARKQDSGGYELGNVYITQVRDNIIDQMLNGKHAYHKVSGVDLSSIKARVAGGESQKAVGKDFGITQSQVSRLINGVRGKYSANIS